MYFVGNHEENIEKIKTYEESVPKDISYSNKFEGNNIIINPNNLIIELNKLNNRGCPNGLRLNPTNLSGNSEREKWIIFL